MRSTRRELPAYEVKFVVDEVLAIQIEELLRPSLALDPHADPHLDGSYGVTTYYFDTPNWDVLRRVGRHRIRKYRLRRYGESTELYVERKLKRQRQVRKRRDAVVEQNLPQVLSPDTTDSESGGWFGRQIARQHLTPTCRIRYVRRAYFGLVLEGPVRLTFDRQLRGAPVDGWSLTTTREDAPILVDKVICEFKYRGAMPSLFKQVVQSLRLTPTGFSKYRQGMCQFSSVTPGEVPCASDKSPTEGATDV